MHADGERVGHLWVEVRADADGRGAYVYVYDVEVAEHARGRGLGRATMLVGERVAAELGAQRIRLNVFGHNAAARRLHDGLGYRVTATTMAKRLDRLLPDGLASAGHQLWTGHAEDGAEVGVPWLHVAKRSDGLHGFGYDLEGRADLRRRGYGRAMTVAAEGLYRQQGVVAVALSVFGLGSGARALCEQQGFTVAAESRVKPLSP